MKTNLAYIDVFYPEETILQGATTCRIDLITESVHPFNKSV